METDLVAGLLSASALTDLVDRRIDWLTRPQGESLPAVTLQIIGGQRTYTMERRVGLVGYLVQVDVWADTYLGARAVKDALIAAIDAAWATAEPFKGVMIDNEHDAADPTEAPQASGGTDFYRKSFDLRVFHHSAT